MIKLSKSLLFFLACLFLISCFSPNKNEEVNVENEKLNLLKVENEFATSSVNKGLKNAYLDFIDSNSVILRPNSLPIVDADAVDYILALNDSAYDVTWKPTDASVSKQGDMGYTFGVYEVNVHNQDTSLYGTYITIWKKQADGKWKFVLQSNNEGVSE